VILLCGIPSEPPMAMVAAQLERHGLAFAFFNQRRFADASIELDLTRPAIGGDLRLGRERIRLEDVSGAYLRLMDDRILPELRGLAPDASARVPCRRLHEDLTTWSELTSTRVVNRIGPMATNGSKPYQAQFARRAGFSIPDTLVSNDPELVRAFLHRHGRVIYKSTSGTRSIVRELLPADIDRLDDIRWCPVQFQDHVAGVDVRVHVVGTRVFATRVHSGASDYRYAVRLGSEPARLEPTTLDDEVGDRCVALSRTLGLDFSGIDLRLADDGRIVCFEVNPCPAYSYYESHTGQPIAQAVARYLAGAD
jgi:hypothetical protein